MLVERPRRRLSDRLSEPPRHWHEQHRARRGSTESELSLSSGDSAAEDDEYDDDGRGSSRLERKLRHALHEERQLRRLLERRVATLERLVLGEDAAQPAAPRPRPRRPSLGRPAQAQALPAAAAAAASIAPPVPAPNAAPNPRPTLGAPAPAAAPSPAAAPGRGPAGRRRPRLRMGAGRGSSRSCSSASIATATESSRKSCRCPSRTLAPAVLTVAANAGVLS